MFLLNRSLRFVPKKQQKRAAELIRKQEPPMVIPRVLERATPDNVSIYISLGKQRAYFRVYEEIAVDSPISSGKRAGMTPPGNYTIMEKDADHRSNIYGDFVNPRTGRVVRAGISTRIDSAPSGTVYRGAPMRWFMRLTPEWSGHAYRHLARLSRLPRLHSPARGDRQAFLRPRQDRNPGDSRGLSPQPRVIRDCRLCHDNFEAEARFDCKLEAALSLL